jgi:hypothetical protein
LLLAIAVLAALAVYLQCMHQFNSSNYYIVSADSYFFHWDAVKIMKKYRADCIVFFKLDLDNDKVILSWADQDNVYKTFPEGCLVLCSLDWGISGWWSAGGSISLEF